MTSNLVVMYERSIFAKIGAKVSSTKIQPIPASGQTKPEKQIDLTKLETDFQRIVVKPYKTALHLSAIWGDIFVNPIPSLESLLKKFNEPSPIILDQSDHIIKLKSQYSVIKNPDVIDLLKSPIDSPGIPKSINLLTSPMDIPAQQKLTNLLKSPMDPHGNPRAVDLLKSPMDAPGSSKSVNLLKSPMDAPGTPKAINLLKSPMDAPESPKPIDLLKSPMDAPVPLTSIDLTISPIQTPGTVPGFSKKDPADTYTKDSEYHILIGKDITKIDTPKNQITLALPVKVDAQGKQSKVTRYGLYDRLYGLLINNLAKYV